MTSGSGCGHPGGGREMICVFTFALPVGVVVLVSLLSGKHKACPVS